MEKRDPREATELTSTRCPSTSMARRTMNSPTPSPSHRAESSRVNASKILESCSPAIPMPVSQTSMRTFWPERRQPMRTRPLGSVYFMALLTKFRGMPLCITALFITGHGEEQGLKVGGPLWVCPACRSQGCWLLGRPHDTDSPGVGDNRKPFICVSHDILSG